MRKKICLFPLIFLFAWSCVSDSDIAIGSGFIDNQTTVELIDTISVHLSTLKLDSLANSSSGYLLAGSYTDPDLGSVSCTGYFQLTMPSATIDNKEVFDSLVLKLPYSGNYYGDTLLPQTIHVHRLLDDLEPGDEETDLYNTSSFKYSAVPLASRTIVPKPNLHDSITIRLPDELGADFLAVLRDENDEFDDADDFLNYFKGMALVPGNENNSILSFVGDSSLQVLLYTHVVKETRIENVYSFYHESELNYCTHIDSDVEGTPLQYLSGSRKVVTPSGEMENKAFLQAGTGTLVRVDFPGISKILEDERQNIFYRAELILKPVPGSYSQMPLPESIVLYNTDKYNNFVSAVTDDDGNTATASFSYDKYYNENTRYIFDVTEIIYDELSDGYVDPNSGLLIMLPETTFRGTMDRVVFDARKDSKYRPTLKLYYIFYQ